jgi:DNA-binding CsgD family transcriptional regulator
VGSHKRKLTVREVSELRAQRKQGKTYGQLAYLFKISRKTAWRYANSESATLSN